MAAAPFEQLGRAAEGGTQPRQQGLTQAIHGCERDPRIARGLSERAHAASRPAPSSRRVTAAARSCAIDGLVAGEIRDGAGDPQCPVDAPSGHHSRGRHVRERPPSLAVEPACVEQRRAGEPPVGDTRPSQRPLTGRGDTRRHDRRGFARGLVQERLGRHPRHRDPHVDAVEQWPAHATDIAISLLGAAPAHPVLRTVPTTPARVHRGDELEPRRVPHVPMGPDDLDGAILERLPERIEHAPVELGELVEEQDAQVRLGDQPGQQVAAATHHGGVAGRVMRSSKGADVTLGGVRTQPRHAADDRDLLRLPVVERRQQTGDGPGEERLAGTRRAEQEQVVAARERDLEGPPGHRLAPDIGEVGGRQAVRDRAPCGRRVGGDPERRAPGRRGRAAPSWSRHEARRVVESRDAGDLDALDKPRLVDVRLGHRDPDVASAGERRHHRQHARDGQDAATQRQLAQERPRTAAGADLTRGDQDADGDGHVVRGAALASVGRREVHGDARERILEARVPQGPPDPFAGLRERRVG